MLTNTRFNNDTKLIFHIKLKIYLNQKTDTSKKDLFCKLYVLP